MCSPSQLLRQTRTFPRYSLKISRPCFSMPARACVCCPRQDITSGYTPIVSVNWQSRAFYRVILATFRGRNEENHARALSLATFRKFERDKERKRYEEISCSPRNFSSLSRLKLDACKRRRCLRSLASSVFISLIFLRITRPARISTRVKRARARPKEERNFFPLLLRSRGLHTLFRRGAMRAAFPPSSTPASPPTSTRAEGRQPFCSPSASRDVASRRYPLHESP